jgi:hypothetical protein
MERAMRRAGKDCFHYQNEHCPFFENDCDTTNVCLFRRLTARFAGLIEVLNATFEPVVAQFQAIRPLFRERSASLENAHRNPSRRC